MQLLSVCTFVCFLWVAAAFSPRDHRNGFLRSQNKICGSRIIDWRPKREPRVIGGEEPPLGAMPWQVQLRLEGKHYCGGALISRRLVLSAAHCFNEELTAVAGAHGPPGSSPHEQVLAVEKFISHPDHRKLGPYSHDIALLLLEAPGFKINDVVRPSCLTEVDPSPGTWCEVSGWGVTDPKESEVLSPVLKATSVPVISLDTCRKDGIYGGRQQQILDSMLCAGYLKGGIDACGGDSGGPLVCERDGKLKLAGVVSWGDGCAKRNRPGVYSRVSSFLPWIKETAQELGVEDKL